MKRMTLQLLEETNLMMIEVTLKRISECIRSKAPDAV